MSAEWIKKIKCLTLVSAYALIGNWLSTMKAGNPVTPIEAFPDMEAELSALAASSQLLSSVDGLYMGLFLAVPMTEWMYKVFTKNNKNYKDGQPIKKNA